MREIRKLFAVVLALCLLLACTGCQSGQDEIYSQVMEESLPVSYSKESSLPEIDYDDPNYIGPDRSKIKAATPAPNDSLNGELTIKLERWTVGGDTLSHLSEEFMQLHPNVKINFVYDRDTAENYRLSIEERQMRHDSFCSELRMELTSGEADYILYNISEDLNLPRLSQNGLLTDMRPYWESDPDIREEDYYVDVLKAFEIDGKMTVIPLSFLFNGLFFDRELLEETGTDPETLLTVNSNDIFSWYEEVRETHKDLNLFFTSPGKESLFSVERMRYIDLENKAADFDSPDFVTFLERGSAVLNDDPELDPEDEIGYGFAGYFDGQIYYRNTGKIPTVVGGRVDDWEGNVVMKSRPAFASMLESIDIFSLIKMQQPFEYVAGPYPLLSTDGKLAVSSMEDFTVPVSCKNKELAWEFIKYCIAPRKEIGFEHLGSNAWYTSHIPLAKETLEELAEDINNRGIRGAVTGFVSFDPIDIDVVTQKLEKVLSLHLVHSEQYGLDVREFLDEFYINELTTPEQAAQKIQGRTEIWLNE